MRKLEELEFHHFQELEELEVSASQQALQTGFKGFPGCPVMTLSQAETYRAEQSSHLPSPLDSYHMQLHNTTYVLVSTVTSISSALHV